MTKLHSPLKTPQADPFSQGTLPVMPIPLTSIQGIQTLLNQVNSVQKEIKKDAEGPLLDAPKPDYPGSPDEQFFTGAEVKTEIPTFDEPKRTPKTIQKSAEIHKKLMKTKPVGIQLKPINKNPIVGPIGIAATPPPPQNHLVHSKTKSQQTNKIVTKTEKPEKREKPEKKQILAGKNLDLIGLKFKFFKCPKCDETFTSKELRDKHQLNNHFDCKGIFSTVSTYRVLIPEPM